MENEPPQEILANEPQEIIANEASPKITDNGTSQAANVNQSLFSRVIDYAKKHIFFVNFFVMNVVCLISVQSSVKDRSMAEVIIIYNAVLLGCALTSQFVTRGYFANDHYSQRDRRGRQRESMRGNFEEEDAEGAGNIELPLPEELLQPDGVENRQNEAQAD